MSISTFSSLLSWFTISPVTSTSILLSSVGSVAIAGCLLFLYLYPKWKSADFIDNDEYHYFGIIARNKMITKLRRENSELKESNEVLGLHIKKVEEEKDIVENLLQESKLQNEEYEQSLDGFIKAIAFKPPNK
jgi:hypothetical protein